MLAVFDQRELLGAPLWFKPLKFTISFTVYLLVLAWLLGRLPGRPCGAPAGPSSPASVIEIVIIGGQAARGMRSHFNDDGGLGSLLFSIMGAAAIGLMLLTAAVGVRFLRERSDGPGSGHGDPARPGCVPGRHVHRDRDEHQRRARGRGRRRRAGAAPGRLEHHRRRPAGRHFVGLHALQLMPLFAAVLTRWAPRLDLAARVRVIRVVGPDTSA